MKTVVIKPRFWPRDLEDAIVAVVIGLAQAAVIFVLPSLIVGTFVLLVSRRTAAALLATGITFAAVYAILLAFTVTSLGVTPDGLQFRRLLGRPKRLRWQDVVSVEPVGRGELILKGWLWPLFPAREMTPSLTSLGHYRITWAAGFCYYPPADHARFEDVLRDRMCSAA